MQPSLRQLFLRPGELFVCREPSIVTTILGSCVAVTLYNSRLKMGAMCHALLADPGAKKTSKDEPPQTNKYVSLVIPAMLGMFCSYGISLEEIEVKLFGGANILNNEEESFSECGIGTVNVRRAQSLLAQCNLRVIRKHVGGFCGRKLIFDTGTGEVLLKQIPRQKK